MESGAPSKLKIQEAVRRWRSAEQGLYPAVLAAPEQYDQYLVLVRAICDELGSIRSVEALVEAFERVDDLAAQVARSRNLSIQGLNGDLAVGAAFCLRYREVAMETRRAEVRRRVGEARARGERWVLLEETSARPQGFFPPWRSLQMHLPEGTGLHCWVEESLSGDGDGVEYGVEIVELDPETGQWLAGRPAVDRQTFTDHQAWQQAVNGLRARYDSFEPFDNVREEGG